MGFNYLAVEHSSDPPAKAWAHWIAYTVDHLTDWPSQAAQVDRRAQLELFDRLFPFRKVEVVARSLTLSGESERTGGAILTVVVDGTQVLFFAQEYVLDLSGDDDFKATVKLVEAVRRRFGARPPEPTGWPTGWSLGKRRAVAFPGHSEVVQPSVSPAPEQIVPASETQRVPPAVTPTVFISYSHRDQRWLDRLQTHLKPLQLKGHIDLWSDKRLRPGDDWRPQIESAIASCRIAILLVSPDFLASDFINQNELPPLLEKATKSDLRILSIIISPSSYEDSTLARYQAVNAPSEPLRALERWKQDAIFVEVYGEVKRALGL